MGIGEPHCDGLALAIFDLGDALVGRRLHLGETLPWRRFLLATPELGVSSPRRRLVLTLTLGVDLFLDFVNARIRDGTVNLLEFFFIFLASVGSNGRTPSARQRWYCVIHVSGLRVAQTCATFTLSPRHALILGDLKVSWVKDL